MTTPTLHRGKLAHVPKIASVRVLTREDMLRLKTPRPPQNRARIMRDAHHRLARYVASGLRPSEIMRLTGYSTSRFSNLTRDPAFQELVALYRGKVDESWVKNQNEVNEVAADLILRGLRKVEEHFDDSDESEERIPLKTLVAVGADLMDRFGYGKRSTQTNNVINFAEIMEAYGRTAGRSNVIDAKKNYDVSAPLQIESPSVARLVPAEDDGGTDG
jgi:hypothetical protein